MSLQIGIIGLPNVGKTTLFNALTKAGAHVAPYPFTTVDPNVGVVPLEDERLRWLSELVQPERTVPASVEFVDIAGLVSGAHRGEGLGNQFLHHIRTVDAVAMVVRAFDDPDVPHVSGEIDLVADIESVDTELILADLATVEKRIDKVKGQAKARPKDFAAELDLLERLSRHLNSNQKASTFERDAQEQATLAELFLLTDKPRMYVINISEEQLPVAEKISAPVVELAEREGASVVTLCAQLEAELVELEPTEAQEYRQALGLEVSSLQDVARAAYALLDLITFFTIVGGREARAWETPRGTPIVKAAGKVHSDMEKGFIRAEVVSYEDLRASGSLAAARERGLLRIEGRDYSVQDGDIIQIRFNISKNN